MLQALPTAISNLHDFLFNVAARLDSVHERIAEAKEAHLAERLAVRHPSLQSSLFWPNRELYLLDNDRRVSGICGALQMPASPSVRPTAKAMAVLSWLRKWGTHAHLRAGWR